MKRLLADPNPFNRLLGQAAILQLGRTAEAGFRAELEAFYAQLDPVSCKEEIGLESKIAELSRPGGYKADIVSLRPDRACSGRFDLWGRRFALLRHLGPIRRPDPSPRRAGSAART